MTKNKLVLLIGGVLVCLILGGSIFYIMGNNTPAKKVEQLEKQVNDSKETSGYNACVAKIDEKMKAQEDCTKSKVAENGYTDGILCVGTDNYDKNPVCKNTTRYNAEVNASNDCIPISDKITSLTMIDCLKLLEQK